MALLINPIDLRMKTNILDSTILGTSFIAGLTGFLDNYAGFMITVGSAILVGYIRYREHKKTMELMELDKQLKQKQLKE